MPVDWKSPETLERLIAAIIASNGGKVDNQTVARYFNDTYHAVENRTRVYKKSALALVKEAEDAGRLDQDMKSKGGASKKAAATPKKVTTATPGSAQRVTKRTPRVSKSKARVPEDSDDEMDDVGTAAGATNDEEI
ncbi:hypothetical protein E4T39_01308 [Aureobasidium subglaciale]|nr:hypothetical protein E4T39_01308 [Aureobasidium subglaciale]